RSFAAQMREWRGRARVTAADTRRISSQAIPFRNISRPESYPQNEMEGNKDVLGEARVFFLASAKGAFGIAERASRGCSSRHLRAGLTSTVASRQRREEWNRRDIRGPSTSLRFAQDDKMLGVE